MPTNEHKLKKCIANNQFSVPLHASTKFLFNEFAFILCKRFNMRWTGLDDGEKPLQLAHEGCKSALSTQLTNGIGLRALFLCVFLCGHAIKKQVSGRNPKRIDRDRVTSACVVIACWHKSSFQTECRDVLLFRKLPQQNIIQTGFFALKKHRLEIDYENYSCSVSIESKGFFCFESQMYSPEVRNDIETFPLTRQTL